MKRKLPDCPRCGDDELYVIQHTRWTVIRCYNCDFHKSLMPPPAEDALDARIAEAVEAAKANSPTH